MTTRTLNEIVSRRAQEAIEAAQESAKKRGETLSERMIAARMAEFMDANFESVLKQLRRCLAGESLWRVDYIEALSRAIGRAPTELMDLAAGPVPDLTKGQLLLAAAGDRLTGKQARQAASLFHQILDDPALFDLSAEINQVLLAADDRDAALSGVMRLILASKAFERPRRSLRGRKAARGQKIHK